MMESEFEHENVIESSYDQSSQFQNLEYSNPIQNSQYTHEEPFYHSLPDQTSNIANDESAVDKNVLLVVHSFLKRHNLESTAEILKKEAKIAESEFRASGNISDADVSNVLSLYAKNENPDEYTDAYSQLRLFIENSLDIFKYEVSQILWPVFVHMYLELVYNEHEAQAFSFFRKFSDSQESFYDEDIFSLATITKKSHLNTENIYKPLSNCLNSSVPSSSKSGQSNLFVVRMSREAQSLLKRFLQEKRLKIVQNIVQERIFIEVYDGVPRGKAYIGSLSGHFMGEASRQNNKVKVYYGLLREPDLQNVQVDVDDDETSGTGETPSVAKEGEQKGTPNKKKKSKKEWLLSKKGKNDPNAPPLNRMPLPELRDIDKLEKAKALRESAKRVTLSSEKLPSICVYSLLNAENTVCCVKWSDDGSILAVGFSTSIIKVWSMTPAKLKKLRPAAELVEIERESDDVLVRMMDDKSGESIRTLRGHSGPCYSIDFSNDKSTMLSSSEDATIRLWSLLTWTCIVVYKGHLYPVWKVVFSPHGGYYFASGGYDRTARLWATDNHQPLRIFAGHYADVTSVAFHPNSNYVASGSSDRSVRLWDCVTGNCVRLMTGHKRLVESLLFSNCGRFLMSAGTDTNVLGWDISNGSLIAALTLHTGPVYAMAFSREGTVLATGGQDNCVRLWNFSKITEEVLSEEGGEMGKKVNCAQFLIGEFPTKSIQLFGLHFTRRNVLLASGPFLPNT